MDRYFAAVFVVAALCFVWSRKICILIDTVGDKSLCYYRQKSWGLACRIWRSSWLTLIAEVDLGSSTTCWSITWPGFMSMSTRGRIVYPMLWRIFWPSKVTAARSQDNSTWPVTLFNVSYADTWQPLLCEMRSSLMYHCNYCVAFWLWDDNMSYQYIQDQQAWLRNLTQNRPRCSANGLLLCLCLLSVTLLRIQHNKAIKSGSRQQYKPLPITLTQCWYILIIFGGERAYRLSCTGQMETNHNNIEQGAVWPT